MGDFALLPDPVRRGACAAHLHRRAVQHPFRIDAAEPDDRRLSVRDQVALRFLALFLPVRDGRIRRPDPRPAAGPRRHRRLPLPRWHRGRLCKTGDRPARRHGRRPRRDRHSQRQPAPPPPYRRLCDAGEPQQPVPVGPPRIGPPASQWPGRNRLRLSALSRDSSGRTELRRDRPDERRPGRHVRPDQGARRAFVRDGRQSRRQPGQPLSRQ